MLQKTSRSNSESFTELTMKGESVLGYCQVTVFTSTYNRRYTLERLYESLRGQTVKPMEWIIVDDGSSDDTYQLIFPWIETEIDFEIIYLRVKNGGKHRAINKACDLARGDLFCIVDSDDYLTNDAIEKIITWEQSIQGKPGYAGVAGNKGFSDHQLIGRTFESEYVDATSLEREKYQIEGDKAEVFYTSVLKKYKFPEIQGENFITESVVWFHIASDGLKIRWFNDIIYIANYLEDGLTKNGDQLIQKNPKGTLLTQYLQASYYQQFILKEKEEVRHYIHEVLVSGDLEAGITYLNGLIPRVKNDIDIQLMLAQLYLYLGKISVAKNILNDMTMVYSKDARPYLKLGKIEERQQQLSLAVSHYQKALLYLDESANQSLIEKLKKTYHFTSNQIDRVLLIRVKEHYKKGELEEAKQLIIKNPAIDESYRLELGFYFNNERFVYYIIGLILGVDDISSSPEDLDYVKAHQLFDQCQYDQSLVYLFKVLSKQLTPLSLYRLSYILKQKGQLGLATKYENLYRLVSNQIKSSGRIYFIEESTTPLHKFRTDINTIFHQMGFHSLNRELELGNFNFSIFDTVLFQYPFSSNVEKIFNSCCTLNLKTILVVHQVEDLNEMIQLNQASRLIVMSHDLKTKLIEQGC
ncbi:MAG: glycosyltransferase, partial [Turicibacter sp.]